MLILFAVLVLLAVAVAWWFKRREREYSFAARAAVITQALRDQVDIRIVYWSKKRRRFVRKLVTPKALNGQVLQAFDLERDCTRTFKVTRIKKITLVTDPLHLNAPPSALKSPVLWVIVALGVAAVVFFLLLNRRMHTIPEVATTDVVRVEAPTNTPEQGISTADIAPTGAVETTGSASKQSGTRSRLLALDQLTAGSSPRTNAADAVPSVAESATYRHEPSNSAGYIERAHARLVDRNYDGAIVDFGKAIEINPYSPQAYLGRAMARTTKGDFDEAIDDATRAINLNLYLAKAYLIRGIARERQGDLELALADFGKAIELSPRDSTFYNGRAWIFYKKGIWDAALNDASTAIELDRLNAQAYDTRGWVHFVSGDTTGAVRDCRQAVELSANSVSGSSSQGLLHLIQGDYVAAAAAWRRAIEMAPDYKRELEPWVKKAEAAAGK